jgi:hypothetical protein
MPAFWTDEVEGISLEPLMGGIVLLILARNSISKSLLCEFSILTDLLAMKPYTEPFNRYVQMPSNNRQSPLICAKR